MALTLNSFIRKRCITFNNNFYFTSVSLKTFGVNVLMRKEDADLLPIDSPGVAVVVKN